MQPVFFSHLYLSTSQAVFCNEFQLYVFFSGFILGFTTLLMIQVFIRFLLKLRPAKQVNDLDLDND